MMHSFRIRSYPNNHHSYLRRHKRGLVWFMVLVGIGLISIVTIQCVYGARHMALPFTRVDEQSVGSKTAEQIAQLLQTSYANVPLKLRAGSKTTETTLVKAGITPDYEQVSAAVLDYPVWQRLIPLTLFKQVGRQYSVSSVIDNERFAEFAKSVVPLCQRAPVDATVAVQDRILVLTPGSNGTTCTVATLQAQLMHVPLTRRGMTQTARLTTVPPTVSTASAQQLLTHAKDIVNRHVVLQLLGKDYPLDAPTIASWLTFQPDPLTKQPSVAFSTELMTSYVAALQTNIYIKPGDTIIQTVDGREVGRTLGSNGRGIDVSDSLTKLQAQLRTGDGVVSMRTVTLPPTLNYNRVYSRTQAGLQALLDDMVAQKGDYAISVRQLGGNGWSVSSNGGKVYTPASTYKLFVAYAVLRRIETGQMGWNDVATAGQTVSACFDNMIVNSDNTCAEWFGNRLGWKTITDMIHAVGLSSATSLYTPGGFVATADDEALFLTKLQAGQLLSNDSTNRLLGVMKRQIYRSGIPAGVSVPVADKVGFLNGLLHDAAIVYAPSGTYVLVIMTSGSSWAQIADVARQIDNQLTTSID